LRSPFTGRRARPTAFLAASIGAYVRLLMVVLGLAALGCGEPPSPAVRVAAAASLADVLPPIARAFEAREHVTVELRFGASSILARQLDEGAEADALLCADPRWVDALGGRASSRRLFASNALVAVVPADATAPPDLTTLAALPRLAVAGAEVPAGMHARSALAAAGLLERAAPHFVEAADVRGALAWVARGECEAGIVYATDARIEPRVRVAFALSTRAHYEAAAIDGSELGRSFVDFLGSPTATAELERGGFERP